MFREGRIFRGNFRMAETGGWSATPTVTGGASGLCGTGED
jgi:hypothetical protein